MKKSLLFLFLFTVSFVRGDAQPFLIDATPLNSLITSNTAVIEVRASVQTGFSATIFISAEAPTLPGATITATPAIINSPYSDSVLVTVHAPQTGGKQKHSIIVIGKNGPTMSRDTVEIEFPEHSAWKWLTTSALEDAGLTSIRRVVVDRNNSLAYVISSEEVGVWDGEDVTRLSTIPVAPRQGGIYLVSARLDSTGSLWLMNFGVLKRYNPQTDEWTVFDEPDASTGLTDTIISYFGQTSPSPPGRMQIDSKGNIWIMGGGFARYDPELSQWRSWHSRGAEFAISSWSTLPTYTLDFEGNIWIAQRDGIVKFDGTYSTVYLWNDLFGQSEPPMDGGGTFGFDREKGVWISTRGAINDVGVWSFDERSDRVERYVCYNEPAMLEAFPVDSIHFDSPIGFRPNDIQRSSGNDELWLALQPTTVREYRARYEVETEGGVMRRVGETWFHYTSENSGLPSDTVMEIAIDTRNQVWLYTAGGLALLDGSVPPEDVFSDVSTAPYENSLSEGSLRILPNPVVGDAELVCFLPVGTYHLSVYSVLGRQILTFPPRTVTSARLPIYLPTESLVPGAYFLQLTDAAGNRLSKMFIRE